MQDKRKHFLYIAGIAVALVLGIWIALPRTSPTQQIERLLNNAAKAAGAKSIVRLSGFFATDYSHEGTVDRPTLLGYAQQFFNETDALSVKIARVMHDDPKLPKDALTAKAIVVLQVSGTTKLEAQKFQGFAGKGGDTFLVTFARRNTGASWAVIASRSVDASSASSLSQEINGTK